KINIGCMYPKTAIEKMQIKGRDVNTGLPTEIVLTSEETFEALRDSAEEILEGIHSVLEETPPELLADITARGIYITGGGGLINGLDQLIQDRTGIATMISEDPISCVALGTGKALNHIEMLETGNAIKIKKF
ncbi:MAG: rod shape-determining protein, partial [Clostridia bacterium]|nr:rod shape-determining protein [Clostridia bacterium]